MPKEIKLKTAKNDQSVASYIQSVDPEFQADAKTLLRLFTEVTGAKPKMWGTSMVGFGEYEYERSNGDHGSYLATGFSIRKSGPTIYIMPGYQDYSKLMEKLGPHKLGKSCLYLRSLEGIDLKVLERLIKQGLKDLKKSHQVHMQ